MTCAARHYARPAALSRKSPPPSPFPRIRFPAPRVCGIIPARPAGRSASGLAPFRAVRRFTVSKRPWSSTAPPQEFHSYVPAEESPAEFSLRAVLLGALFGLLFGAVTVYVGLRAGLTVSASIPIAVLSISILRAFGRSTILENNIVQTTGSAGESVAAGVIFTLPALIFLGFGSEFTYWRIFPLALLGGWLGVLFMIPLRRQLIVKEHGNLTYPEGTACADVLVAGERGGSFAGRVFWGLGLGGVYTFLMNTVQAWTGQPEYRPSWLPGASFRAAVTSEYLGVGYIIGPKVSGILFAGGIFSWLLFMPAIRFFGQLAPNTALYPSTVPIPLMSPDQLWSSYVRPMGAGAVAAAGLFTLLRTLPTILSALRSGLKDVRAENAGQSAAANRIDRDMSMRTVIFGSAIIIVMMWLLLTFRPIPGAQTTLVSNLFAAVFVVVFGFLFVTVASRISGLLGNSSNPISGMTIATLMATCAVFLVSGWTAPNYAVLALTIGGVVCIAAAIAGATSQDLKTGYLVGATPYWQQVGLLVGVTVSTIAVGGTLALMNKGLEKYVPSQIPLNVQSLPSGVKVEKPVYTYKGQTYTLINALGSREIPDGEYLYDANTKQIEIQWVQGIGSDQAAAPQARLMATVISGILNQRLPWRLVLMGVALVVAVELLGVRSLAFAVGSYLSIATTMAIFAGGVVHWLVERASKDGESAGEASPGALYSSGLIAAGGVFGLLAVALRVLQDAGVRWPAAFGFGPKLLGPLAQSNAFGVLMFALLSASLFYFARKKLS
ncbi:MAG: oligopeptide transporter, OPT family [Acidobacteriia bacterium]|nr:oligopeptide transporter, OPT family [Terriglobia bacterium]